MINLNLKTNINLNRTRSITGPNIDYADFMVNAGYPRPYPQQVKMKEYFFDEPWTTPVKMILATRFYGKTDYITIGGNAEAIAKNKDYEALIVTKLGGRGREYLGEIRRCLIANNIPVTSKGNSRVIVSGHIGKEPNAYALSIKSTGLRSRHPNGIIFLEDIVTPDDISAKERAKVFRGYEELLKVGKRIAIIGQPVHALDIYQQLRGKVPTLEIKYGTIPELDADLDAMRAAGVSEKSIQASYFLNIEDSLSMPFIGIELVNSFPTDETTLIYIDPAKKGGAGNDYTAIVAGRMLFNNFIAAGFCFQKSWHDCLPELAEISNRFKSSYGYFETNFSGPEPVDRLNQLGFKCFEDEVKGNKHGRIMQMAIHTKNIKLAKLNISPELNKANEKFIEMVKQYEYNIDHDDGPDALASLMRKAGLINGF